MSDINKIIRVLDLSQSEAREGTLDGIVKFIIYIKGDKGILQNIIVSEIIKEFTIEIHEQEIGYSIERLIDNQLVQKNNEGNLVITSAESLKIRQESLKLSENRTARFESFKQNIIKIAFEDDYAIVENEINDLWEIFRTFIYDCYLTHGKNIIDSLTNEESDYDENLNVLVKKYLKEVKNKKLSHILLNYIKIYPEIVDSNILEYLRGLSNKTESFYSLGLPQEEYKKHHENLKFDWIVFVDTNFIYSILDLHNNPEKQSAKFLLELGTQLGIKFKYTVKTFEELNNKKTDFEKYLKKDLLPSQINALLKSGKLDSFAETFYERLIEDKDNTPHPSEIILHSQNSMKSKSLILWNSKFEALTKSEDLLLDEESAFNSYLEMLDEVRESKGLIRKGQKDPIQVQHDIFLREAILQLRSNKTTSMSNAKYFGVTLDKTLIKFDLYRLRRKTVGTLIPTFFKPSILLKKLLRQAPLKVKESYLRAFIKTISTPAIDNNNHSSKVAIRSIKYFHKMGIDNEKLILDCLKDELFLKSFEKKENDTQELEDFFESEINKQITIKTEKIEELKDSLKEKDDRITKVTMHTSETRKKNKLLHNEVENLKDIVSLFGRELKKIKERKSKSNSKSFQLDIFDEKESIQVDNEIKEKDRKNKNLTEKIIEEKLKNRNHLGYLYIFISCVVLFMILMIYMFQDRTWNFIKKLIENIGTFSDVKKSITYIIFTLVLALIDIYIFNKVRLIFFNKKAKKEFINDFQKEINLKQSNS
jgi:hypothetical protein